ncbi:maleylpyruvate isomerase family mycothiol-dependent enzyme [Nocardioides sp. HM23]|uniref:maleylpyruvate isomerase family mycothiol-dependent enzyme n=1 Tax=Nocardioides bizhenqiangii TaxID=3095076 RepID=UPI002ACA40D4|nr:maleylpyruvate isomerase family mycothiol-dependent enzyme [Nocardioides sp. HM23]MDZ5620341.1 maleylpyruvate isomerase family mycothiol-dependent enzyme [Nocardioides sp. HM23]
MTEIEAATARLIATADRLRDDEWPRPTECAGWSRAHVLAHLALNAEGLAGALRALLDGEAALMYGSQTARDADIETLAAQPAATIRDRLRTASDRFAAVMEGVPRLPADASFERTPQGQRMLAHDVPLLRLAEVEIHHADLRAGYGYADWPRETAVRLLERDVERYDGPPLSAHVTDLDRTYRLGSPADGDPVVSGPVAALAWWLTGRDPGEDLSSSTGELPEMEG